MLIIAKVKNKKIKDFWEEFMKFSEKALMDLLMKINFMGKGPKKLLNKCYALF